MLRSLPLGKMAKVETDAAGLDKGYYVQPTVFADVPEDAWIWNEEIFGPVVCVRPFDSEDEAVG